MRARQLHRHSRLKECSGRIPSAWLCPRVKSHRLSPTWQRLLQQTESSRYYSESNSQHPRVGYRMLKEMFQPMQPRSRKAERCFRLAAIVNMEVIKDMRSAR